MNRTLLAITLLVASAGCARNAIPIAPPPNPPRAVPAPISTSPTSGSPDPMLYHPNEAGVVPILEYHNIGAGRTTMDRPVAKFRVDLERLYREGYRPVSLHDYLNNRIGVPAGKSPVILTFDDARNSQFRYLPDGTLDPNCAVAILDQFHAAHPDFALKATFYVLPLSAFGQPKLASRKFKELISRGYEIGNHTVSHNILSHMTDAQVQKELAGCVKLDHALDPDVVVNTLALPYGIGPKNRALARDGSSGGVSYHNIAVLLVGASPAPSPVSRKFNPFKLPRVQACEGPSGITYWLDDLKRHPQRRYVSDGVEGP